MMQGNGVVGIRREDKTVWERRAPLTPQHVKQLKDEGVTVIIQPSTKRAFTDHEYEAAGGIIRENLSGAATIIGVKEVPAHKLLPHRTYLFFSHTIKGQLDNMPLLDSILEKRVRLLDYECITQGGLRGGQRLVAFGSYAGVAGMIDFMHGLGKRYLMFGYATPFLHVAPSYTYASAKDAKQAVDRIAADIRRYGLPADVCPMTFVFTGTGNVSKGAQEIVRLLPHSFIDPEQLPALFESPPADCTTQVYAVLTTAQHFVQRADGGPFDKQAYYAHPELYRPVFHSTILPFTSVLINGIYWERRYPRIVSNEQLRHLNRQGGGPFGGLRLVGVCDVTCDLEGSVECLKKTTLIDQPFFVYNPETEECIDGVRGDGILMLGVDQLPTEFATDATQYFGDRLLPFIKPLAFSDGTVPYEAITDLPAPLKGACIAMDGKLTPLFEYIAKERMVTARAAAQKQQMDHRLDLSAPQLVVGLEGHLFDSGLINHALDLLEQSHVQFSVLDFRLGMDTANKSFVALSLVAERKRLLTDVVKELTALAGTFPFRNAEASVVQLKYTGDLSRKPKKLLPSRPPSQQLLMDYPSSVAHEFSYHILLLGAGMVAGPLVEYLLRKGDYKMTICSVLLDEAQALASRHTKATPMQLDLSEEAGMDRLKTLVSAADVCVSLVPAHLHPLVADICIQQKKHLVTASYVSPQMQALHDRAVGAGVMLVNEAGLDPGIDHMSAMALIHRLRRDKHTIVGFRSYCGGLPSPEAADNPLGYKFSWSARGVLTASVAPAKYRLNGQVVDVPGESLLLSAQPVSVTSAFNLEMLPNRDSISYESLYEIESIPTIIRGTLRYRGFSDILAGCVKLGLMDGTPRPDLTPSRPPTPALIKQASSGVSDAGMSPSASPGLTSHDSGHPHHTHPVWADVMRNVLGLEERTDLMDEGERNAVLVDEVGKRVREMLAGGDIDGERHVRVMGALEWLGLLSEAQQVPMRGSLVEAFCACLQQKLAYSEGERDMALMQHTIEYQRCGDGAMRRLRSTLCVYGDQQATAMAKTVGFTAAICTDLILQGRLKASGVVRPVCSEVYVPALEALNKEGISFHERDEPLPSH
ncbi:unnamed protein product [Vitrella brassicaformis CCMP3155]|uniref:Uncharacterized protein n=1 Tax=Vitrella brassicaformis (strain CCMP3155) TaxID=1169540 RepID=A0A0G4F4R8_VITBC|nr:unnamed protein product [Vitrella brassicaformis CCMP3155]|eukprot:CEM06717.1 unnamed protein product [Vitrella brassicaformis CCMP3155]